jgi:hypothetical protein
MVVKSFQFAAQSIMVIAFEKKSNSFQYIDEISFFDLLFGGIGINHLSF